MRLVTGTLFLRGNGCLGCVVLKIYSVQTPATILPEYH
jgi:hypothetical protein